MLECLFIQADPVQRSYTNRSYGSSGSIPFGKLGAIHSSSLPNLVALGLTTAAATKLLTKLFRHAVHAAQAIVHKKRELEQELWGGNQHDEGQRGVG